MMPDRTTPPQHAAADESAEMQSLVHTIGHTLDEIAGLERVWARGVVHRGGPHYRLQGMLGPISLGEDECLIFGQVVREFRPATTYIIGNAFGFSSVFIAKWMEQNGGSSIITLDSKSEGDGEYCFRVAAELRDRMNCRLLKNKAGWSPDDVSKTVESATYDLIFIDGDHSHPQVTRDLYGVMELVRPDSVLCWHDYWLRGVPESVEAAQQAGFLCLKVNTSCEMVFGTRSPFVFQRLAKLFPDAQAPIKQRHPFAYLKLYQALGDGAVKRYILGRTTDARRIKVHAPMP